MVTISTQSCDWEHSEGTHILYRDRCYKRIQVTLESTSSSKMQYNVTACAAYIAVIW